MYNGLAFFGAPEQMIIIFVLVLVLFGGKKIPELMRGVGQGVGELKKGLDEGKQQFSSAMREEPKPVEPIVKTDETVAPK